MRKLCIAVLLIAGSLGMAAVKLTAPMVGFNGYYRVNTLVPVAVQILNEGDEVRGELHLVMPTSGGGDTQGEMDVHLPLTLPAGAHQLRMLYLVPREMLSHVTVEFIASGQQAISATTDRLIMLNDNDWLIAVIGGNASSLGYLNGQPFFIDPSFPQPRSWDYYTYQRNIRTEAERHASAPSARSGMATSNGIMHVTYLSPEMLPENPEAYGSITEIALMSDVTENSLGAAQQPIKDWVGKGGHLLCAAGGVPARFQAPFFADMLQDLTGGHLPSVVNLAMADGRSAVSAPYRSGRVTLLSYDPDLSPVVDWHTGVLAYGKELAMAPPVALALRMYNSIYRAVMVQNLEPINMHFIMLFLLGYVLILVPVNFFVLKKMNKREWIWATSLGTIFLFTLGAYCIGVFSKGHHLVVNNVTVVETSLGQRSALADSQALIFSPSNRNYTIETGDGGLFAREAAPGDSNDYDSSSNHLHPPLQYILGGNSVTLRDVPLDMWGMRQFSMVHRFDLGNGFSGHLILEPSSLLPKGAITNNTPYTYYRCSVLRNATELENFALLPGQTVDLRNAPPMPSTSNGLTKEEEATQLSVEAAFVNISGNGIMINDSTIRMICYCTDPKARIPMKVNGDRPTTSLTVVVVKL